MAIIVKGCGSQSAVDSLFFWVSDLFLALPPQKASILAWIEAAV